MYILDLTLVMRTCTNLITKTKQNISCRQFQTDKLILFSFIQGRNFSNTNLNFNSFVRICKRKIIDRIIKVLLMVLLNREEDKR